VHSVRRGFSVPELLISLTAMSVVFALATHFAVQQMRFFRNVGDVQAVRSQLDHVTEIARNVLVNVSPSTGELLVAQDSALEVRLTTGTSFVCSSAPGRIVIPAPMASSEGVLSAFARLPAPGDRVSALFSDSLGATWLHLQVASPPDAAQDLCAFSPEIGTTWSIATVEPMTLPSGSAVRFARPLRLSLYESSDNRWYLGARDWNGDALQFNAVQPVAGPLLRHDDGAGSGLRFLYHDNQGSELFPPVDVRRVASVTVVARAATDSMLTVVRLPNAK
jgi:prepilin-type N-terminal cleavage/methylation domain-containing protein